MKAVLLLLLLTLSSCAQIHIPFLKNGKASNSKEVVLENYSHYENKDYIDHLKSLKYDYLDSINTKEINLDKYRQRYLNKVVEAIIENNELFFTKEKKGHVHIINDEAPFHFSLPGKNIFISSGLIKKYIKSENILFCLLTYELIISEKNIYKKRIIIPTGAVETRRILSLLRLKIDEKVEVHKWAFYILKRIGLDTDNYLSWLQIQNRNSVDFSLQLGDIGSISREESLFKAFIIKNTEKKKISKKYKGSSKDFYSFVKALKR